MAHVVKREDTSLQWKHCGFEPRWRNAINAIYGQRSSMPWTENYQCHLWTEKCYQHHLPMDWSPRGGRRTRAWGGPRGVPDFITSTCLEDSCMPADIQDWSHPTKEGKPTNRGRLSTAVQLSQDFLASINWRRREESKMTNSVAHPGRIRWQGLNSYTLGTKTHVVSLPNHSRETKGRARRKRDGSLTKIGQLVDVSEKLSWWDRGQQAPDAYTGEIITSWSMSTTPWGVA